MAMSTALLLVWFASLAFIVRAAHLGISRQTTARSLGTVSVAELETRQNVLKTRIGQAARPPLPPALENELGNRDCIRLAYECAFFGGTKCRDCLRLCKSFATSREVGACYANLFEVLVRPPLPRAGGRPVSRPRWENLGNDVAKVAAWRAFCTLDASTWFNDVIDGPRQNFMPRNQAFKFFKQLGEEVRDNPERRGSIFHNGCTTRNGNYDIHRLEDEAKDAKNGDCRSGVGKVDDNDDGGEKEDRETRDCIRDCTNKWDSNGPQAAMFCAVQSASFQKGPTE